MKEEYRLISDSQWRYMHRKLNDLQESVSRLRRQMDDLNRPKRYLKFSECIPPESICRDVNSMLLGNSSYDGFVGRLSEYYGIEPMGCYVDATLPVRVIAQYRLGEKNAYSRNKTVGRDTILHEFFHHLTNLNVVSVPKDQEEKLADKYARIFLQRAGWFN
jgi:hypothetical protein